MTVTGESDKLFSMGERNRSTEAIILSVHEQGENNRSVCALSPENGIFYSTLYGGPKSSLRSLVQPFNTGTIWLYDVPSKNSVKITDFDVKSCHLSFRVNLFKMWAANLASELIIKTHCAGESKSAFILLKALTDGMEKSDEKEARLGLLRFMWRYLSLLGLQPDVTECSVCSKKLLSEQKVFYSPETHSFLCSECFTQSNFNLNASGAALTYLAAINTLSPKKVRTLSLTEEDVFELKKILYFLIEEACSSPLQSIKSGAGIL